jgi:hypothetical protein
MFTLERAAQARGRGKENAQLLFQFAFKMNSAVAERLSVP